MSRKESRAEWRLRPVFTVFNLNASLCRLSRGVAVASILAGTRAVALAGVMALSSISYA